MISASANNPWVQLLHFEAKLRSARTIKELQFLIANQLRGLLPFRQSLVLKATRHNRRPYLVQAVSGVTAIDHDAPMIQWIEDMVRETSILCNSISVIRVLESDCLPSLKLDWKEFSGPYALWCPLRHPDGSIIGALWLDRELPWQENEILLLSRLSQTVAHAWKALQAMPARWRIPGPIRSAWVGLPALALALCIPIRLSTLAPAKVVAKEPSVVSAPLDGVIAEILIAPNRIVTEGDLIFRYENTTLRSQYEVAERHFAMAKAELQKVVQSSFGDPTQRSDISLRQAEVRLREIERDYAKDLLRKVDVLATRSGILIYSSKEDWIGKPVIVGERIMEISDPTDIEIKIDLAVKDAILLQDGAEATVFFDALPLERFKATVTHASYHAETLPGDVLAYRVVAAFSSTDPRIRIGWQGTAKLFGTEGPLAFLIFRRPLTALRQFMGY
jgi:multidrug resistance efflux pump